MKQYLTVLKGVSFLLLSFLFSCQQAAVEEISAESGIPEAGVNESAALNGSTVLASTANSAYWTKAQETHNFIVGNTLTQYNSYRANLTTNVNDAFEWYNVSHIYADAEMVRQGDTRYVPYMNNTYTWMGNMWDNGSSVGGYFSAANLDGSGAGGDKYVDDNSITGVTYLDCYAVSSGTQQTQYLNSAKAVANWLMFSGVWDNTYNGGFWWNDNLTVKPTQTNGLAMQLLIRLYGLTGSNFYLDWANSVMNWLESEMYDPSDGLFIWQIESGGVKRYEKFTYDNAIMIEAYLAYYNVTGNNAYLTKAQNLGISLNTVLWNQAAGVYEFNTNDPRVNPAWCGWASQAMIKLYEADGNTAWLDYAQDNIDFINAHNRDNTNHGYYHFTNLDGSISDGKMETVDQAWMQRIQAMLAEYR